MGPLQKKRSNSITAGSLGLLHHNSRMSPLRGPAGASAAETDEEGRWPRCETFSTLKRSTHGLDWNLNHYHVPPIFLPESAAAAAMGGDENRRQGEGDEKGSHEPGPSRKVPPFSYGAEAAPSTGGCMKREGGIRPQLKPSNPGAQFKVIRHFNLGRMRHV